jgi:transcriptional regulator with XRE-family HTH domain
MGRLNAQQLGRLPASDLSSCADRTQHFSVLQLVSALNTEPGLRDISAMDETIGMRVAAFAAKNLDINKMQLAQELGVQYETVRKWVKGSTEPNPTQRKKIADLLGKSEQWVLFGGEEARQIAREITLRESLLVLAMSLSNPTPLLKQNAINALTQIAEHPDDKGKVEEAIHSLESAVAGKRRIA